MKASQPLPVSETQRHSSQRGKGAFFFDVGKFIISFEQACSS
jgi:hypothetical protein